MVWRTKKKLSKSLARYHLLIKYVYQFGCHKQSIMKTQCFERYTPLIKVFSILTAVKNIILYIRVTKTQWHYYQNAERRKSSYYLDVNQHLNQKT